MKHTWLVQPGRWRGQGIHRSANGELPAFGEAVFTHHPDRWINDSYLTLRDAAGTTWRNLYQFAPLAPTANATEFTTGSGRGHYAFVDDTILVTFEGGCESLLQIDQDTYHNRGVLYGPTGFIASWAFALRRVI